MERALELWGEANLPPLKLKEPWYAYELGYWPEERQREAALAVDGRHFETGAKFAERRVRLDEDTSA
jgi:4-hydroxy-3-polyprenylbenzoate decarboxylase